MLRITVLNDNRNANPILGCEHGLSLFLESGEKKILFDTGNTDLFLKNAEKLGIRPEEAEMIVLSHGDYDHTGGLRYLPGGQKLLAHPACTSYRISRTRGTFAGMPMEAQEIQKKYRTAFSREPVALGGKVTFLGEIERKTDFEGKNFPMIDREGKIYPCPDDSGLMIETPQGLIVISGCAHSGICNTVEYAKKLSGTKKVCAVLGGFHLLTMDAAAQKTIDYMRENVEKVYLAHCTADEVCEAFREQMPDRTEVLGAGTVLEW
ncbi:MAG: MBL fold metallo-hydrolase [Lachnospiraceae bacterium]|nr:MBL fold metallo-hydrolase [Lachnospiraceae bacterium]